jgi:hypothetical protein
MTADVLQVAAELIRHPIRNLLFRWNWKSALLRQFRLHGP